MKTAIEQYKKIEAMLKDYHNHNAIPPRYQYRPEFEWYYQMQKIKQALLSVILAGNSESDVKTLKPDINELTETIHYVTPPKIW